MTITVHVRLLDEPVHVWRPVLGELVNTSSCLLVPSQSVPEGEIWEFRPGQRVTVERRELSGSDVLVAVAEAQIHASAADAGNALIAMKPMEPMKPLGFGDQWWPKDLGEPSSSGGQNDMRYAFFPNARRLLIQRDGKLTTYDSGDHKISGVSQQSSGAPTFTSEAGEAKLDDLTVVR